MPNQSQISIGLEVKTNKDIHLVYQKLGIELEKEYDLDYTPIDVGKNFQINGETICVYFSLLWESESDYKIVGFDLTSRYKPKILDKNHGHGRPDIFAIDLEVCRDILSQTRKFLPEAQLYIRDIQY